MFTQKTKNAIRIVSFLIENQESKVKFSAVDIAGKLELKLPFLSKILQELAKNKIISSTKGRGGGFYMSQENKKNTIIDVITIFEDPEKLNDCILGLPDCSSENPCILHHIYKDFRMDITSFLKKNIEKVITN